jgi:DnaJ-domain-containing protein 1
MRAVGMAIASLRTFERTGAKEVQRRAYTGFARLPAGGDHWATLGLARGSSVEQIMGRYRDLAREHHPDRGGSAQRFDEISKAMQAAIREVSP